ncbi:Hsp70 family protein [Eubacteriaceae bacterium ES3]|nr:Hsp70 family protein [Eubacteriaceae bacterium ES3]
MGIKVGIDLGTTFSAVAMMDEKNGQPIIIPNTLGERITPSVIQFTEDDEIIVGSDALEAFETGESGCASVFKRSMGNPDTYCSFNGTKYTAEDLSTILLRYLKEEVEAVTHQKVDEAVVTVPAYFYHKERQATMKAAKKAGLKVRQIINEPTAAAMNYGVKHWRENARVLVYDLGGGTFDVTLVQMKKNNQMESLQTTGDHTLGGKDWDARICALVESKIGSETGYYVSEYPEIHQIVTQNAENIKKQLTSRNVANVRLNLPEYGWYSTTMSLEEFEQNTADLIERTGTLCESLLRGSGIGWRDITDILLVGGSTRMRQVSAYLKRISGHTLAQVNPDEAVALGAAIQVHLPLPEYSVISMAPPAENNADSGSFFKFKKAIQKTSPASPKYSLPDMVGKETALNNALCMSHVDVVAHAMGVIAVSADGIHYINKTIVPANQRIPVKCAEAFHYYTSARGDNEMEIYVLQGVKAPLECEIIGKYVVSGINHDRNDNPTTIKIQYSYDINGMVHVQVRQGNGTVDLPIREEPVLADMSKFGRPIDSEEMRPSAEALSVVMAVDVSGSMSGKPIDDARNAMCHFVDNFEDYPGDVEIGVIAVSDKSQIVQPLTSNLSECKASIRSITECMTGVCNAGHPFNDFQSMLGRVKGKLLGIVLADGMWENQSLAVSEARKCHRMDIDITGIGFGSADEQFLRDISSGYIDSMLVDQSELIQSFGKIAQEIGGGSNTGKRSRTGAETAVATWLAINE